MISTHGYVGAEPEFGKPDTGGQVVYVLELSKCLARLGFEVDILTRRFEGQSKVERVADRCRVMRFPCGGNDFIPKETLWEHIPEWVENVREFARAKRRKYGYILSHYWDAGIAGQSLAQHMHIPHVHVPHSIGSWKRDNMDGDPDENERKYNFKRRIREEKAIYDECDGLIATTPQQRDIVTDSNDEYNMPRENVYVIPPGYDDSRFFPVSLATRQALKRDYGYDGRIVLALGRMAHNKGYDLLIRAMAPVCQRIPDAKLLLAVGSTEPSTRESEQIQELKDLAAELGLSDRVSFHDYIEDHELADYYRLADVFALSSRYEPFGMTAVEAMACGTSTVITTEGGLFEQVTYGLEALYANPFDTEAFGHAICQILQHNRIVDQLSRHGSHKARAAFTWMGIAQQVMGVLQGHRMQRRGQAHASEQKSAAVAEPGSIR
jgi:mannosylfructose-phosphate synthase